MTAFATDDIQELIREHVASEIVCQTIPGEHRIGCVMPLQYENGDSVVVWVERWGDRFHVSDYGEAFIDFAARTKRDRRELFAEADQLSRPVGVQVRSEALAVQASRDDLGDAVWRTATAAALVAQMAIRFRRPRRQHGERVFVQEVEQELLNRSVAVQREVKLEGHSGHAHRATLYVATVEAVLEPIEAPGHFNQISSVYTKFGDLAHANGYRRLSLIDDRTDGLGDDLAAMLIQVSDVVRWTRRDEWLQTLT